MRDALPVPVFALRQAELAGDTDLKLNTDAIQRTAAPEAESVARLFSHRQKAERR